MAGFQIRSSADFFPLKKQPSVSEQLLSRDFDFAKIDVINLLPSSKLRILSIISLEYPLVLIHNWQTSC